MAVISEICRAICKPIFHKTYKLRNAAIINHRLHRYSIKSADIFNGNLVAIRSCLLNFFIYSQVSRIFQTLSRPGSPFERVAGYRRTSKKIRRNRFNVPWLIERRKIDVRNISKIVRFFNTPGVVIFCVRNTPCPLRMTRYHEKLNNRQLMSSRVK